jgi:hypothetical protein
MASLTPNREAVLGAMWWLFSEALFYISLANTTGAASPPALDASYESWSPYVISNDFDLMFTADAVSYDATIAKRAVLPQLDIVLDYDAAVTYTDVIVLVLPVIDPGGSAPSYAFPFVGIIHEPTAVTLTAAQTKTYKLDLYSEWF